MSRPYAEVIGDPIAQSKSPTIHNFWLEKLGIDAEYRARHVRADELADYFAHRRRDAEWRGCNVTMPHKQAVQPFLGEVSDTASRIAAVNAVFADSHRLFGENTDAAGIREALSGGSLAGRSVCLIGSGGAARAALEVLAIGRVQEVLLVVRDRARAHPLLEEFRLSGGGYPIEDCETAFAGMELIINASPLGMVGQPEIPEAILDHLRLSEGLGCRVFDMVYAPVETRLLRSARRLHMDAIDGLTMLIGQAAAAFEKFFGQPAPRQHDAELRALLTA